VDVRGGKDGSTGTSLWGWWRSRQEAFNAKLERPVWFGAGGGLQTKTDAPTGCVNSPMPSEHQPFVDKEWSSLVRLASERAMRFRAETSAPQLTTPSTSEDPSPRLRKISQYPHCI
jgi:hypothetical protein